MKYKIHTTNINNSLVFYRALFGRMPDIMEPTIIQFIESNFNLVISEQKRSCPSDEPFYLEINDTRELSNINNRIKRFRGKALIKQNCEEINKSIGLMDLDGYKWIIGEYNRDIRFDKCYINANNKHI